MRKNEKHCEGCRRDQGARFRTMPNLYLCGECYKEWLDTGDVPLPNVEDSPVLLTDEPRPVTLPKEIIW